MASSLPPSDVVLVYDGACALCEATARHLVRRGWVGEERARPFQAFEGETADRLLAAGFRNEVAVMEGERIHTGIDGLGVLLRAAGRGRLARFVAAAPVAFVLRAGYALVAPNRRILAPLQRSKRDACACEPAPGRGRRWAFLAVGLLLAGLFALAAGALLGGAATVLAVAGGSTAFSAVLFARRMPEDDAAGKLAHVVWAEVVGSAFLMGVALLLALVRSFVALPGWLFGDVGLAVLALLVLGTTMGVMLVRRARLATS